MRESPAAPFSAHWQNQIRQKLPFFGTFWHGFSKNKSWQIKFRKIWHLTCLAFVELWVNSSIERLPRQFQIDGQFEIAVAIVR